MKRDEKRRLVVLQAEFWTYLGPTAASRRHCRGFLAARTAEAAARLVPLQVFEGLNIIFII